MLVNIEPNRSLQYIVLIVAFLLVVGCGTEDKKPPIILDEESLTTAIPYSEYVASRTSQVNAKSKSPSRGPLITIAHEDPGYTETKKFNISVLISTNPDTGIPINLATLKVDAGKHTIFGFKSGDPDKLNNRVLEWLDKSECDENGLCEKLAVQEEIELEHGSGKYEFFIDIIDKNGQKSAADFSITRG